MTKFDTKEHCKCAKHAIYGRNASGNINDHFAWLLITVIEHMLGINQYKSMALLLIQWCNYIQYFAWHTCLLVWVFQEVAPPPLVPWINHLPPVCWSTFGILVWNDSGYVNLTQWWYFFIIFEYILHISTPHIMIFCFPLPYFPLSTSALFFA